MYVVSIGGAIIPLVIIGVSYVFISGASYVLIIGDSYVVIIGGGIVVVVVITSAFALKYGVVVVVVVTVVGFLDPRTFSFIFNSNLSCLPNGAEGIGSGAIPPPIIGEGSIGAIGPAPWPPPRCFSFTWYDILSCPHPWCVSFTHIAILS
jgi:hypothetical protein